VKAKAVIPREQAQRDVIDVWRVLHGERDIPAWMKQPENL